MDAVKPLLQTRGLSRSFGGLKAVDAIDFTLDVGEIRAIIGPNGAGKTTFVGLLAGRIEASEGSVLFDGEDITRLAVHQRVRRGIAYTFQITNIYPAKSVVDNVRIAVESRVRQLPRGAVDIDVEALDALAAVGLSDRQDMPAGMLAYGHQRLLEIAMGLALRPKLLILDEPTQGLSDAEIQGFLGLVRKIAASTTVLLIEHNMSVVMALATRISVLARGQVLAEGTPDEISANAEVQAAYLGS
jgi:branched-chain amino acid transport system ATP-binding protein